MVRESMSDVHTELDAVRDDLKQLRSDLSALLRSFMDQTRSGVGDAKHRVQEEALHRFEQVQEAVDSARKYGKQAVKNVRDQIEERPILTVLGALGVGLLIGNMLRRSRS